MSQNSSPYVSDAELKSSTRQSPSVTAGGVPSAPMPSLFSHPPLRLQRKPVVGTILKDITGKVPLLTPPPPASSSSPSSSLPHLNDTLSEPIYEEATFPCPYCAASFKKVGHLNRHKLKHTGTRFHCKIPGCDKTFSRQDNMRTHMKNMHPSAAHPNSSARSGALALPQRQAAAKTPPSVQRSINTTRRSTRSFIIPYPKSQDPTVEDSDTGTPQHLIPIPSVQYPRRSSRHGIPSVAPPSSTETTCTPRRVLANSRRLEMGASAGNIIEHVP